MSNYNPHLIVPADIVAAAYKVKVFLATNNATSVAGMGDVNDLQRKLDEATRELEHLRILVHLADQLVNKARGL